MQDTCCLFPFWCANVFPPIIAIKSDYLIILCLQVMSKGRIVQHGRVQVAVKAGSGKKNKRHSDYDGSSDHLIMF